LAAKIKDSFNFLREFKLLSLLAKTYPSPRSAFIESKDIYSS